MKPVTIVVAALAVCAAGCDGRARGPAPSTSVRPPATARNPLSPGLPVTVARPAARGTAPVLHVPRAPRRIVPSGHFDPATWSSAASTHTLLDASGLGAVPISEGRFLWGSGQLYLLFYAGDLDLEVRAAKHDEPVWDDDSFTLSFVGADGLARVVVVSATGVLADGECPRDATSLADARCNLGWNSNARAAADYDGTPNTLGDFDEEWNIQLAIPLRALGVDGAGSGSRVSLALSRCERAYDGVRACGAWGTVETPAELILD